MLHISSAWNVVSRQVPLSLSSYATVGRIRKMAADLAPLLRAAMRTPPPELTKPDRHRRSTVETPAAPLVAEEGLLLAPVLTTATPTRDAGSCMNSTRRKASAPETRS